MTATNHPSVVVVAGGEVGAALSLDQALNDFLVGSAAGCDLVLSGNAVSPLHAGLFLDDEGNVTVSDRKSGAGVFVNGTKVLEHTITDGDEISIGPPDDPGRACLRFVAKGSETAILDSPESGPEGLVGLEGLAALESTESESPFDSPAPLEMEPLPIPDSPLPEMPPEFEPLEISFEPEPPPASDPSLLPMPLGVEAPSDPDPLPFEISAEPSPMAPPAPSPSTPPSAEPPVPAPAASTKAPSPQPALPVRKRAGAKIAAGDAGDPLAGLAESLGGASDDHVEPPPATREAPAAPPKPTGMSPAAKLARLALVATVLGAATWFGTRRYAESIVVPVVDTYLPNPAEPGRTVTLNGSGFGAAPDPAAVKVFLGSVEARVLDANPTRINIEIPESMGAAGSQTVELTVTAAGGESSTPRLLKVMVTPRIDSLSPRVGLTGDEIAIAGKWLSSLKTKATVTVAGNDAEVLEATPDLVRVRVPSVAANEGQKVSVRVALGQDVSKDVPLYYGRLPFLESVSPERALPGEVVTLRGLGLAGSDLSVLVGGRPAAVLSSADAEIRISAPGIRLSDQAGRRDLRVEANGNSSMAHPFEILRESSSLYSPRFFVEKIQSRVVVSCELGPVMALGPDQDSGRRAHDAAARLNALAGEGRGERVLFRASGVTIDAPGGDVLKVAIGDGGAGPRVMAGLWAAHLSDMFDLFLQGRRGGRTLELSPDGMVYIDMFAAARRRSTQPGVPVGLLSSPDPAWVRSLVSLAVAPKLSGAQAAALLDGFWAGVIEGPGAVRAGRVEISLTFTPSGLVGQRTSRQGRLSTDERLQNLSFGRRDLRFSFIDSGESLNYSGRLDGDVIEGTVTRGSGANVGKLDLRLTR